MPHASSQVAERLRRPVASTTSGASRVSPSSQTTPVTRGGSPVSAWTPWTAAPRRHSRPGNDTQWRRRHHSKVMRRQASRTSSSSSGTAPVASPSEPARSEKRMRSAPCSRSASSSAGTCSANRLWRRARKAWEWLRWGDPRRSQASKAASGVSGSGLASRSNTVTRAPRCASASAVSRPATLPPTTTASRASVMTERSI